MAASTLPLARSAAAAGSLSLSAGTSSAALGSVVFSNSNNVSFGLSGSTVTGSVAPPGGVSAGTASVQLGTVVFSNSNNVSFGLNGSTVTASATVASTAGSISVSAGTSSANLGSVVFSNANGVSFGLNGSTVTASVATALTSQSNQAASASNGSFTFQTLNFSNANNVTFGTSAGGIVTASVAAPGGGGGALTLYAVGNTSGASSATATANSLVIRGENYATVGVSDGSLRVYVDHQWFSAGTGQWDPYTLYFSNANGVSFGLGAGASQSILTASVAGGGGSLNVSAGTTSNNLTNVVFSNANGVSFGLNGSTVTASVNAGGGAAMSVYAFAATNTENKLSFQNSNGITFGLGGGGSSNLTASHNGLTSQSNQAASASAGSFTFQTLNFSNANNVTFGTSAGGIITASVAAPGGGAGATVGQWPPVPWPVAQTAAVLGTTGNTGGSTQITASATFCPLVLPVAVTFGKVLMQVSFATAAGTGSASMGWQVGIYSLTGNTLSRVDSWMWRANISQNSVTAQSWSWWSGSTTGVSQSSLGGNVSATFTRLADLIVANKGAVSTLSAGQYWIGMVYTRRSSNAAIWNTAGYAAYSVSQFTAAPEFGSNTTAPPLHSIHGLATNFTTNVADFGSGMMPASLATSVVNLRTGGASRYPWPVLKFVPGT